MQYPFHHVKAMAAAVWGRSYQRALFHGALHPRSRHTRSTDRLAAFKRLPLVPDSICKCHRMRPCSLAPRVASLSLLCIFLPSQRPCQLFVNSRVPCCPYFISVSSSATLRLVVMAFVSSFLAANPFLSVAGLVTQPYSPYRHPFRHTWPPIPSRFRGISVYVAPLFRFLSSFYFGLFCRFVFCPLSFFVFMSSIPS